MLSQNRTLTTNTDTSKSTRALTCGNVHTCSLTLQCLKSIRNWTNIEFLFSHTSKGSGNVTFFLYAVTYDYDFVKQLLVFLKSDVEIAAWG